MYQRRTKARAWVADVMPIAGIVAVILFVVLIGLATALDIHIRRAKREILEKMEGKK